MVSQKERVGQSLKQSSCANEPRRKAGERNRFIVPLRHQPGQTPAPSTHNGAGFSFVPLPQPVSSEIWEIANSQIQSGSARQVPVAEFLEAAEQVATQLEKYSPRRLFQISCQCPDLFTLAASLYDAKDDITKAKRWRNWWKRAKASKPKIQRRQVPPKTNTSCNRINKKPTRYRSPPKDNGDGDSDGDDEPASSPAQIRAPNRVARLRRERSDDLCLAT